MTLLLLLARLREGRSRFDVCKQAKMDGLGLTKREITSKIKGKSAGHRLIAWLTLYIIQGRKTVETL